MYFYGDNDYQSYLVFPPTLHSLVLDNKVLSWQSTSNVGVKVHYSIFKREKFFFPL